MLALIRQRWNSWRRDKGLALLAVVALGTGIGCATSIFTVVDAVLLKPLPYSQGDRWIGLFAGNSTEPSDLNHFSALTLADLSLYQELTHSFDVFGWFSLGGDFNLTSPGEPRHIEGIQVSPSLIRNTGVHPIAGRFFEPSDGPNVAIISSRLFRHLGSNIIGRQIRLNGRSYTVLGAMPEWFRFPLVTVKSRDSDNDAWLPMEKPQSDSQLRDYGGYAGYGKLRTGVTLQQAQAEAKRAAVEIRKQNHPFDPTYTVVLFSLRDMVVEPIRPILLVLLGAACLLLLITCANVAGLLVSRAVGRARETAIRVALGGGQNQLALQYFCESLFLSVAAVIAGLAASVVLVRLLLSIAAEYIPRANEIAVNWPVIFFALGLGFVTATLSAMAPLWQAIRMQPNEVLGDGVRASAGARSRKLSQILVIAEIALAATLLSSAAILLWRFQELKTLSPGFDPKSLLTFQLTKSDSPGAPAGAGSGINPTPESAAAQSAYSDRLLEALEALPGVSGAALTNQLPLNGCCMSAYVLPEGRSSTKDARDFISLTVVSTGYFRTLRIPLVAGRLLNGHDTNVNLVSALINEEAAKRFWPGENAVGQFGRFSTPQGTRFQVVGVVGSVRNKGLGERPEPEIYLLKNLIPPSPMQFVVRSNLSATTLAPAIRRAISRVAPDQPIYAIRSFEAITNSSLFFQQIESIVVSMFALAALLLAASGIYSLTSYSVRQRTTELGTRMALGATGYDVLRLVITGGLRLSAYGLLSSLVGVAVATALVSKYLDVAHVDPEPYLLTIALVVSLAALASFVPGWRASILSPLVAIRNDTDSLSVFAQHAWGHARNLFVTDKPSAKLDSNLLTEFVEASRTAQSFSVALGISLAHLRKRLGADSALLLERVAEGQYCCRAATPSRTEPKTFALPDTGFLSNRLRFYSRPLSFAREDLGTAVLRAREQKPQLVPELELLQSLDLGLAALLRTNREVIGLLLFGHHTGRDGFSSADVELLAACTEQLSLTLANARLNERLLEQEKIRRDIELATEVQKRLLPASPPACTGISIDAYTLAARSVGGDYYDFFEVGERYVGIALADIAGKGIAAALIMAVVQASLRILVSEQDVSLPDLVEKMNRFLHRSTGSSSYATFFFAQFEPSTRRLRYVNAGHNPPYLARSLSSDVGSDSTVRIEELNAGGMIIGMFPTAKYEEAVVDLQTGDILVAFTDGVTEALDPAEEEFGEQRLQALIKRLARLSVEEMKTTIANELDTWIADAPQHDDMTFVLLKVNDPNLA